MVFNFRRRKNKNNVSSSQQQETAEEIVGGNDIFLKKKNRRKKELLNKKRQRPLEFSTPLGTIEEGKDEVSHPSTGDTAKTTEEENNSPPQIHVLNNSTGEAELVIGDNNNNEVIKKQLFMTENEEPFDAQHAVRLEDPHILEVEEREEKILGNNNRSENKSSNQDAYDHTYDPYMKHVRHQEEDSERSEVGSFATNIINAFNCSEDTTTTTLFFDKVCASDTISSNKKKGKRNFYNDVFAFRFVQETMIEGIPMLYHHPPKNPTDDDNWMGQSMNMFICPGGDCSPQGGGITTQPPRLEWRTKDGGWSRLNTSGGSTRTTTIPVSLMDIHSIFDDDQDVEEANGSNIFFSITTKSGTVHLLECSTEQERDRVVTGIRNILSRLAKSIITGDDAVTKEMYTTTMTTVEDEAIGDLPLRKRSSIKTNAAHSFLIDASHDFLNSLGNNGNGSVVP